MQRRGEMGAYLGINILDFRWVECSTCCCLLSMELTVKKG